MVVPAPAVQATITSPLASSGVVACVTTGSYAPTMMPAVEIAQFADTDVVTVNDDVAVCVAPQLRKCTDAALPPR